MEFASLRASKARYVVMLSLLSGLSFFQYAAFAPAAINADDALSLCQLNSLPQDIRSTLDRRFYGWTVQESSNLVPQARQKWAGSIPLACPGIAAGHFEDSRSVSYALLLIPEDRTANGYKFVMFTAPRGQSFYGFKMLEESTGNASACFIHSVPIDQVFDSDLKKRFRPKAGEAVVLSAIDEKTSTQNVYYWTGENYDRAQVDF